MEFFNRYGPMIRLFASLVTFIALLVLAGILMVG
jgi:hypothetical protein